METFTKQELIDLAHAARKYAVDSENQASETGGPMRDNTLFAAKTYRELSEKCERMAKVRS